MMKKCTWSIVLWVVICVHLLGQSPDSFLAAYHHRVEGNTFKYHSPLPDVNHSLLVRANNEYPFAIWETEQVPDDFAGQEATFVWMYAMDVTLDRHLFQLWVDNQQVLSFTNPSEAEKNPQSIVGKDGARLTFRPTLTDKYGDQMGFAYLSLPSSSLTPGQAVQIRIQGDQSGSLSWFMVFTTPIKETIQAEQVPVVQAQENDLTYAARFQIMSLQTVSARINIPGIEAVEVKLQPGNNAFLVNLPETKKPKMYTADVFVGTKPVQKIGFSMQPVKPWTVYLVQHTHTDIGYTRPQTEILPEHLRYIDFALDYCDQTDAYPDAAKFRWTCESAWAVREYLRCRPDSQINRLRKRVQEGRIEVTGMFFNYSETLDENGLAHQLQPLKEFKAQGIPVRTAMQNDVNGIGWALADYFPDMGVKYLSMGQHNHRALIPFDKPTTFWWESPSGKRMLAYRTEHYMHGNVLGVHMGDLDYFGNNLFNYLMDLDAKEYAYNRVSLNFSGYVTDNSPPSTFACDLVKAWNQTYVWPRLQLATAADFLEYMETTHGPDLETHRVAWPDWWTDGAGTALREMAATRQSKMDLIATNGLFSMALMGGAQLPASLSTQQEAIDDALLFYDEHTYGAEESIKDYWAENSMVQWNEKAAYAWESVKRQVGLREQAMGLLQALLPQSDQPTITVFNTLNFQRSGLVEVYVDHQLIPQNRAFRLTDSSGNKIAAQALGSRSDGTYWAFWVDDIPAMGYKTLRVEVLEETRELPSPLPFCGSLENAHYRLVIDSVSGGISSWYDKHLQQELTDPKSPWLLGQFIYEQLDNRAQLEGFRLDTAYRSGWEQLRIEELVPGPIWTSVKMSGQSPACADARGVQLEIRLYHPEKRLELHYGMHKLPVPTPEAAYVAFPFELPNGHLLFEAQGGPVQPGVNQLEGTASDWNTIQQYAAVKNHKAQIVYGSTEVPLVQFGDLNLGHFQYISKPAGNHIYSWVLNNYWTTNFCARQEGELKWSYFLHSGTDTTNAWASRFAWASNVPLPARVLPARTGVNTSNPVALPRITDNGSVLLVGMRPLENHTDLLLHYRETNGVETDLLLTDFEQAGYRAELVNAIGEKRLPIQHYLHFKPFEVHFVKLSPVAQ